MAFVGFVSLLCVVSLISQLIYFEASAQIVDHLGLPQFLYLNQISSCTSLTMWLQTNDTASTMANTSHAQRSKSEATTSPVSGNSRDTCMYLVEQRAFASCKRSGDHLVQPP
ncbi:hypothetical protein CRYUN_Cryun15aG0079100 [Craigia yunnanensis]